VSSQESRMKKNTPSVSSYTPGTAHCLRLPVPLCLAALAVGNIPPITGQDRRKERGRLARLLSTVSRLWLILPFSPFAVRTLDPDRVSTVASRAFQFRATPAVSLRTQ
jgi:hypothetical protein